jgi:hypothetical protein
MIFPLLFVFASRTAPKIAVAALRYQAGALCLIGYLLASNLSYFPHYLSYFNEFIGDRTLAYTVLADSNLDWGQNASYLVKYLSANPDAMYTDLVSSDKYQWQLPADRVFDPDHPRAGRLIISANELLGITTSPDRFRWIRERLKPSGHVAYSFLIFDIQNRDLPPM